MWHGHMMRQEGLPWAVIVSLPMGTRRNRGCLKLYWVEVLTSWQKQRLNANGGWRRLQRCTPLQHEDEAVTDASLMSWQSTGIVIQRLPVPILHYYKTCFAHQNLFVLDCICSFVLSLSESENTSRRLPANHPSSHRQNKTSPPRNNTLIVDYDKLSQV